MLNHSCKKLQSKTKVKENHLQSQQINHLQQRLLISIVLERQWTKHLKETSKFNKQLIVIFYDYKIILHKSILIQNEWEVESS